MQKLLLQWVPVGLIVGLLLFQQFFVCWVLLITILLACIIWLGLASLFKKKLNIKEPEYYFHSVKNPSQYFKKTVTPLSYYKLKIILIRFFGVLFCLGGLFVFVFVMKVYNLYLDLPAYFKNNFKIVVGTANITSSHARGFIIQTIEINDIKLDNHKFLSIPQYQGKLMKIYYLPLSKFVLEIWIIPLR